MSIASVFSSWREHYSRPSSQSNFLDTGCITGNEFVEAGDYLVHQFPTWQWASGDASKVRDILPFNKQYLVSHGVPCANRVDTLFGGSETEEDGFVNTHRLHDPSRSVPEIEDIDVHNSSGTELDRRLCGVHAGALVPEMDLPDEDYDEGVIHQPNTVLTRTYDLYITYDKYYKTPRMCNRHRHSYVVLT